MSTPLAEKLISTIQKAKNIQEMVNAYNDLTVFYYDEVEKHRKELIEKAAKLPKNNNGNKG
jgi:allophanate hydrolase subunit 1